MNFMKYPTKNDISISNAVLKLAKLQNAERLELTAATGAVIVTSGRMTAKELLSTVQSLTGRAAELIVCGGSPCQDLSVAGARAGLSGARSGLFMEQVRLVKEMRNADEQRGRTGHAVRPRYISGIRTHWGKSGASIAIQRADERKSIGCLVSILKFSHG